MQSECPASPLNPERGIINFLIASKVLDAESVKVEKIMTTLHLVVVMVHDGIKTNKNDIVKLSIVVLMSHFIKKQHEIIRKYKFDFIISDIPLSK